MSFFKQAERSIMWLIIVFLLSPVVSFAQEEGHEEKETHHRVSIMIAHTHVPKGVSSVTGSGALVIPSWGLNYEYWFNRKWAIGLHNDMEISTYVIEDENGGLLERTRPLIVTVVGIFNPWKGLELITGFGREFEEHQNFWVYRFGIEYELGIGHHWDIAPALTFDVKENLYDSWTLGLVIGKRF
jgi:hypothetical protein